MTSAVAADSHIRRDFRMVAEAARTRRRAMGQVCTPRIVADFMARWVCADRPARMLDPALGEGVFVEAIEALISRSRRPPQIDAFEIDAALLALREKPNSVGDAKRRLHIRAEDFLLADIATRYDAIIANPPYVRHHSLSYGESLWRNYDALAGRRLSRATNLYGLFLVRIWSLLRPGGRASIILPAEWLNADFGVALKAHLLDENAIDAMIQFDPTTHVFCGALTTAVIALLRRGRREDEPIRMASVKSLDDLPSLKLSDSSQINRDKLDPAKKWSPIFEGLRHAPRARNGSRSRRIRATSRVKTRGSLATLRTLRDVATCSRGIATGANAYFALREADRRRWGIDLADLRPCITKAAQIRGNRLNAAALNQLIERDERIYLLHPRHPLRAVMKRYLAHGQSLGVHQRHLPSHRPCWYMPENRAAAPILIAVFSRGDFRVVLNEVRALNLTAYHGIYPRSTGDAAADTRTARKLYDYLCSPAGQLAIAPHRRIYGGGLFKLEPRDVESVEIPSDLAGTK